MKIKIGPYKNHFGPYQLAELLCFWAKEKPDEHGIKRKPDWVHKFGEWLAHGSIEPEPKVGEIRRLKRNRHQTLLYKFLLWLDSKYERKIYVKIDRWDSWSADHTLALIILPLLKQIKENKNGSPFVDDTDVPEHLKSSSAQELSKDEKDMGHVDANHHLRWEYVIGEMIFAFENIVDDSWQDQFYNGEFDFAFKKLENGMSELVRDKNDTSSVDREGLKEYQTRIDNGLRLFGKYYQSLWT
jgi:hypothetical protein